MRQRQASTYLSASWPWWMSPFSRIFPYPAEMYVATDMTCFDNHSGKAGAHHYLHAKAALIPWCSSDFSCCLQTLKILNWRPGTCKLQLTSWQSHQSLFVPVWPVRILQLAGRDSQLLYENLENMTDRIKKKVQNTLLLHLLIWKYNTQYVLWMGID